MISTLFFFFNDTATTEIYTLSLHDALPILPHGHGRRTGLGDGRNFRQQRAALVEQHGERAQLAFLRERDRVALAERSEEHTSELQSQSNLVCRLLLEKKNQINSIRRARCTP